MKPIPQRWRRRVSLLLAVAVAFLLGSAAQDRLGVSFTVEGLEAFRHWVPGAGSGPGAALTTKRRKPVH